MLVLVFFGLFLALGLSLYKDYGIYFDDHWCRENGVVNAKFIANKVAPDFFEVNRWCPDCIGLEEYSDADHGPIFELVPTILEWLMGPLDLQLAFQMRHLCVFLFFILSCGFFYQILQERFRKPWLGLLGVLLLILSPRIFAESFYNSKDLPFLSISIICVYTLLQYFKKPSFKTIFWHALACGLAIDMRLLGLTFPALTLGFSVLELKVFRKDGNKPGRTFLLLFFYLVVLLAFIIAFWPYLWNKPFVKIPFLLDKTSQYPWMRKMLYQGQAIPATNLPWHYLPVWFFITTPVGYSILFLIGLVTVIKQFISSRFYFYRNAAERQDLILAAIFAIPMLATIILKLVLYDSWRHMYFIYPAFIYVAVLGFYSVYERLDNLRNGQSANLLRNVWPALLVFYLGSLAFWMIRNHPHQNVYFSIYSSDKIRQQYELDYWGLAYKQGLEFVIKDSDKPQIKVYPANLPGRTNQYMLPPEQRKRLVYVDKMEDADYFLTEYRWHPKDYPLKEEALQIKVDDIKIFSVFRLDTVYHYTDKELFEY